MSNLRLSKQKLRMLKRIKVVAGILFKNDEVLIAQRAEPRHEGKWEFPGGKVEEGETPEHALQRELLEESELKSSGFDYFCTSEVAHKDKLIVLLTYRVQTFSGTPKNKVHKDLRWVKVSVLTDYRFLDADIPVIDRLISDF